MSLQANGVAPTKVFTGDGDYTVPKGYTCIGYYVDGTEGNVTIVTGLGERTEASGPLFYDRLGHVLEFKASGTTAVGITAYLIK